MGSKFGFVGAFFCLPHAVPSASGCGDREAVDEESESQFGIGCNFYLHINGFCIHPYENLNPLSSSVTPYGRATFPAGEG